MSPTKSVLRFTKLSGNTFPPLKGSAYAAGWDIRSAHDYLLPARGKLTALTDIQFLVPDGCYGRVGDYSDKRCS